MQHAHEEIVQLSVMVFYAGELLLHLSDVLLYQVEATTGPLRNVDVQGVETFK
jgi:hypothetical protein